MEPKTNSRLQFFFKRVNVITEKYFTNRYYKPYIYAKTSTKHDNHYKYANFLQVTPVM
jgi:hypothetical protein